MPRRSRCEELESVDGALGWTNQQGSRAAVQDCNVPPPINLSGNKPMGGPDLLNLDAAGSGVQLIISD